MIRYGFYMYRYCCLLILISGGVRAAAQGERIRINQLGYYPYAPKTAVLVGASEATAFYILRAGTKDTVFRGVMGAQTLSNNSSLVTRALLFSDLQRSGRYTIAVPGVGVSYSFTIGARVQQPV